MRVFKKSSDKKQKTFLLSAPQPGSFKRGFHVDIGESGKLIAKNIPAAEADLQRRLGLEPTQSSQDIVISVDPNSATGFKGLPVEWEALVKSSCITKEEVIEHPRQVLEALEFQTATAEPEDQSGTPSPEEKVEEARPIKTSTDLALALAAARRERPPVTDLDSEIEKLSPWLEPDDPTLILSDFRKIGEGSSGSVYKCFHNKKGLEVALKIITLTPTTNFVHVANELQMLVSCRHPNVVQPMGIYHKNHKLWITMEYMEGGALTEIISLCKMTEPQISAVMKEVLRGLQYIHESSRIHRDIKSDNLLLSRTGQVKLADFGYCTQLKSWVDKKRSIVGTPYWMAPGIRSVFEFANSHKERADQRPALRKGGRYLESWYCDDGNGGRRATIHRASPSASIIPYYNVWCPGIERS